MQIYSAMDACSSKDDGDDDDDDSREDTASSSSSSSDSSDSSVSTTERSTTPEDLLDLAGNAEDFVAKSMAMVDIEIAFYAARRATRISSLGDMLLSQERNYITDLVESKSNSSSQSLPPSG